VRLVISKRMLIGSVGILMAALLIYNLPVILLGETVLSKEVGRRLQNNLNQYGLNCNVKKVRWIGGGCFAATGVAIDEKQSGELLVKADRLLVRTDFLQLIRHVKNPETVLRELEIIRPQFRIVHYANQTWNFSRFFGNNGKRTMKFSYKIKVRDGQGEWEDYKYGKHQFQKVNGEVDLSDYPVVAWRAKGRTTFGKDTAWSSNGQVRSDQASGRGVVKVTRVPLAKAFLVMGKKFQFTVKSGLGHGTFRFAWNRKNVWVQNGDVQIDHGVVKFPFFKRIVQIKAADVDFNPEEVMVNSSKLNYQKSEMRLTGLLDIAKLAVKAKLDSKRARVEDLLELFPKIPNTIIAGRANFNLDVNGLISNPVFDGKMALDHTDVDINGERFTNVTGKMSVKKNNIQVPNLKGIWHEAPIVLKGTVANIFNPCLNLNVETQGVKLDQMRLCQMLKPDLNFGHSGDFTGKLTGYWDTPLFSGEVRLEQFVFRGIAAQDIKAAITWEPMLQRVKIFSAQGKTWGGDLAADGLMSIDATGMKWNLTGKISGVNLKTISQLPDFGLAGEAMEADAVFKGAWKYGAPFDPGTIMGVVKGNNLTYLNTTADEASAVYRWQNGNLTVDSLQIKLGNGRIFGNLTLHNAQIAANISAENIKLGQFFGHEKSLAALDGIFMGNMTLEGDLADLKGKINGEFVDLAWNKKPIGTVQGELEYDHRQKEVTFQELTLNSQTGDYRVKGKVDFADQSPKVALQVDSGNLNVKEFLKWSPVKFPVDADGVGKVSVAINGTFADPSFDCKLNLVAPQIGDVKLDEGLLEFNGDLNKIHLTKCELVDSHSRVYMTGIVERDNIDLVIGGYCNDLESLQLYYQGNLLKGRLDLDGRLAGSLQAPVLTATLQGAEMSFGELKYPNMTARIKWAAPELEIYDTQLGGGEDSISASGKIYTAKSLRYDLSFKVNQFQLRKLFQLAHFSQDGFDGKFSGNIIMAGSFENPQVRLNGEITEGTLNSVPVTGEVTLSYGNDKVLIEKIGLCHSTGSFYATGVWEKGKTLCLRGRLNEFPLETVNPWLTSYGLKLSGLANADVGLEWSGARFKCDYQLESTSLQVNNDNWGSAFLSGDMNEDGLNISEGALSIKNGSLGVTGFIPWPAPIRDHFKAPSGVGKVANSLDLRLLIKNVPANLINAYVPNFTVGNGEFNGNLYVAGDLVRPEISGKLECSNGQLEIPDLSFRVDAIQAGVTIEKNHVFINNKASGYVGKGRISLTGEADFSNFNKINLNLDCEGSRVFFKNYFYDGFADFSLKLAGTLADSLLMGNITVHDTKVGGLSLAGNNKKAKNDWNPGIDLMVKMGSKVRYRQIGVADVSVNGTLHIKGDLMEPLIGGEMTTKKGVISFYGQTFKVDRGEAVFSYNQGLNPYLDIEASLPTQKAMISLKVKGQAGTEILPVLSAQPALTQKEIFALLNWSDLTGEKPLTVDSVVEGNMGMVTDTLLGDVFYKIRDAVGFDYLYLETDYRSNEYRINAGDYITDKLFVSYTRYLVTKDEDQKDKWNYDYHFTPEIALGSSYSASEGRSWRLIYTFDF
jgi:autotransporter translocation and assembly factor TamB